MRDFETVRRIEGMHNKYRNLQDIQKRYNDSPVWRTIIANKEQHVSTATMKIRSHRKEGEWEEPWKIL